MNSDLTTSVKDTFNTTIDSTVADRVKLFVDFMNDEYGTLPISSTCIDWLIDNGFFTKPAAVKYHGNYTGGLFDHSLAVTKTLVKMTKDLGLKWQSERSPYIVGMFHDLCKIDDYVNESDSGLDDTSWTYNKDKILTGHGDKSVMLLSQFINLTEEELMCIRFHMGAYKTDDWDAYDKAIRKYETVLWTHTADMFAAKVLDI